MYNITLFASGNGSNAENIINFFDSDPMFVINLIVCDNPSAFVLQRAHNHNIKSLIVDKVSFNNPDFMLEALKNADTHFIVLSGFLKLVPEFLVNAYQNKIINIHPALLPAHGGKGMYGMRVHQDVINCGDKLSGITIHFVNKFFDSGAIIFQASCNVVDGDTPDSLAQKVHALEYLHFPRVIKETVLKVLS